MQQINNWFTEVCKPAGTKFGLEIIAHLHQEQTDYQVIDIYHTKHFGNLMVIDGCIMLTARDNFIYHEMMAHCSLASHPQPQDILIIGGGDCGTLQEVCKHPINSVVQVEIDAKVTELSQKYFPELCTANEHPAAKLLFADAVAWVQDAPANSLDVIIIDSTDPIGPGEGLFTTDFYANCARLLRKNGLLIHQSESPLLQHELLTGMRSKMLRANYSNVSTVFFPLPTYPSGWWSATLASKEQNLLSPRILPAKITDTLKYYSKDIHISALTAPPFVFGA